MCKVILLLNAGTARGAGDVTAGAPPSARGQCRTYDWTRSPRALSQHSNMAHNRRSCRAKRMLDMLNENNENKKDDVFVDENISSSYCQDNNYNLSKSINKEILLELIPNKNSVSFKEIGDDEDNGSSPDGDFGSSSSDVYIPGSNENNSDSSYVSLNGSVLQLTGKPPRRISTSDSSCSSICSKDNNNCDTLTDRNINDELNNLSEEPNQSNDAVPSCSFWDNKIVTREGRKRKVRDAKKERRCERFARNISRNKGEEYFTKTGKYKKGKELKELPDCRAKCKEKIPKQVLENVFTEYWHLGSYEKRTNYISNFIIIGKKKVSKIDPKKKREHANKYVLKFDNSVYNICKKCFLTTFDESNRFIQTVCEKKIKCGNVISSERGRAASYKKIHDDRLEFARQHILKFPAYESHYGRSKTSKTFLSSDLSLAKMYDLYKETTTEPISKTVYNHVFKTLNLSFKQPSVDTCQKCDRLNKQLETATSEEDTAQIKSQLQEHQDCAAFAYDLKDKDKNYAKESTDTLVLTFDLQQCLPTPYLKTGMVFYKRQLWTYNLTIHDCVSNKAHCYIWDESISGRGANHIASCVYDFLKYRVPNQWPNVTKIILYSDTCAGQNKNSIMATMMIVAAHDLSYIIEHKFLTPGHTRMEVDSDHSLIERAKKRTTMNIHHPRDWAQLIRSVGRPGKFTVIEMAESNFYDFSDFLKQNFIMKKYNEDNIKFVWADVKLLRFDKTLFPYLQYKTDLQADDFNLISLAKRGKNYGLEVLANDNLLNCKGGNFISNEKKNDLISLLPYIDSSYHDYYKNLKTKADIRNIDPDLISSDED